MILKDRGEGGSSKHELIPSELTGKKQEKKKGAGSQPLWLLKNSMWHLISCVARIVWRRAVPCRR
jgi:hypothetical protein